MKVNDIVKAWRNPAFRSRVAELPENPAGMIELNGTDLDLVGGGKDSKGPKNDSRHHGSSRNRNSKH